jgi:hypothetical protein
VIKFNVTRLKDGIKRFVLYPFVLFVSFVVNRMRNANNGMQADVRASRGTP